MTPIVDRKWIVKEPGNPVLVRQLAQELGIDHVLSELLVQRGIKNYEQAREFFRPDLSILDLMMNMGRESIFTLKEMLETEELYEDEIASNRFVLGRVEEGKAMRREKISAHTARRTFISSLIHEGVSPYQVMNMSGHTKLSTMDIYVEKFAPTVQEATLKIEI